MCYVCVKETDRQTDRQKREKERSSIPPASFYLSVRHFVFFLSVPQSAGRELKILTQTERDEFVLSEGGTETHPFNNSICQQGDCESVASMCLHPVHAQKQLLISKRRC